MVFSSFVGSQAVSETFGIPTFVGNGEVRGAEGVSEETQEEVADNTSYFLKNYIKYVKLNT